MRRTWILGGAGVIVIVGVLLAVWFVAARFPTLNGDTSRAPRLFHEPYNGIDFNYPATWADVKGEHGIADFKGARGCELAIFGFGTDAATLPAELEQLRRQFAQEQPLRQFSQRPAWAGASPPAAAFAMATNQGRAGRQTDWETVFPHGADNFIVSETMQEGDQGCRSDLLAFERSFRLYPRDTNAK